MRGIPEFRQEPDGCFNDGSSGFTMVELVVIGTIIAILTAISVPLGLNWIGTHRFTSMVRTFPNAVLMARMRGLENRYVIGINGSLANSSTTPFSGCCPGMIFVTTSDHGLSGPIPALAGNLLCSDTILPASWSPVGNSVCRKTPASATAGDSVMISGLDKHLSMNGVEFEVVKVYATDRFAVVRRWISSGDLPDSTKASDTTGVVRNVASPGRLRIEPAMAVSTATAIPNQENFAGSDVTVKEEGYGIVFRYNTDKFQASVNGQLLDTATPPTSAQITFDTRGFPKTLSAQTVWIAEKVPPGKKGREVTYKISTTGKVDTLVAGAKD